MDDLAILYPVIPLTINGEEIEIKEYSLKQQLRHRALFKPFIHALRQQLSRHEAEMGMDAFMDLLAEHEESVLKMVALSCGKSVEFVENLRGEEAENIFLAWWTVNADFFTRQAVMPMLERLAKTAPPTTEKSLSSLWQTDTDSKTLNTTVQDN